MSEQEKEQLAQPELTEVVGKMGMHGPSGRRRELGKDEDRMGDTVNPGATSFAELDEVEAAEEAADMIRKRTNQFNGLIDNIMMDPDVEDKAAAIGDLASEFGVMAGAAMERKERWQPLTDAVVKALRPLFGKKEDEPPSPLPAETEPETKNSFMVYKEADGGYRWLAIYSNKFRDRDNPPEIISEASHIAFNKAVNSGELPFPELWLWHVKGSKWGEADFVGYDDNGFAVATGIIDKGREWIADALMGFEGDLLTSHGMGADTIERDPQDQTIITRHVTKEISPLPANVAANEFTGFSILGSEVKQMAFTDEERARLTALGVDPERLEAEAESKAKETEGLEFKEADKPEATSPAESDYVSRDEVADLVKSVATSTNQLVQVVGDLAKRIEIIEENKLALDRKTIEETPAASLAELYKSVIGAPEAKVDGRSALAKSGPEETAPDEDIGSRYGGGLGAVIARRNQEIERGGVQ